MADRVSPERRSELMSRIRRANTKPELTVRSLLHSLGYRFRVQLKGVPGRPDIALPARKRAIFIHGCFWHAHEGCPDYRLPQTRTDFWRAKFERNRARDARLEAHAREQGWDCLTLWECEIRKSSDLPIRLRNFLGPPRKSDRRRRGS